MRINENPPEGPKGHYENEPDKEKPRDPFALIAESLGFSLSPELQTLETEVVSKHKSIVDADNDGTVAEDVELALMRVTIIKKIYEESKQVYVNLENNMPIILAAAVLVAGFRWKLGLLDDAYNDLFGDEGAASNNALPTFRGRISPDIISMLSRLEEYMRNA